MFRRDFLKLLGLGIGAAALEQAIPLNRVWSFPKNIAPAGSIELPPGMSLRFIRAYDVQRGLMISRLDVLHGFPALPPAIADCYRITNETDQAKVVAIPRADPAALQMLKNYQRVRVPEAQYGVTWPEEAPMLTSD